MSAASEPAARISGPSVAAAIIVVGAALAGLFAWRTPAWQAPDEPAHANYIVQVVLRAPAWPVMEPGDWDPLQLERLQQFPDLRYGQHHDRAGLTYEDHQPPLYYALMAPPFLGWRNGDALRCRYHWGLDLDLLSCDTLVALGVRWLSILLLVLTLILTVRAVGTMLPTHLAVGHAATAFIAFLPMYAYMSAVVNNDALANLVMAIALLAAVRRVAGLTTRRRYVVWAGLIWGTALLTKLTVYPVILPLVVAEGLRTRREGAPMRDAVAPALRSVGLGLLIAAPWFIRNMFVYGITDPFGLAAHDRVVVGQPRTADWIAEHGWGGYLERAVVFTFDSFWGVFGWMAAFMDRRIYIVLALASVIMTIGFAGYVRRAWRASRAGRGIAIDASDDHGDDVDSDVGPLQRDVLVVFGLVVATTVGGYVWYNLTFVQHQGRYLFPALIPIATAAMLGIREWARWLAKAVRRPAWAEGIAAAGMAAFDAGLLATSVWALVHVIPTLWPGQ